MVGQKRKTKYQKIQKEGRHGQYKSRSNKLKFVKTPSGRTVVQYKAKRPSKAKCASCGAILSGVPNKNPNEMKKMPKTARRPERPYGGVLCSKCTRAKIKEGARK